MCLKYSRKRVEGNIKTNDLWWTWTLCAFFFSSLFIILTLALGWSLYVYNKQHFIELPQTSTSWWWLSELLVEWKKGRVPWWFKQDRCNQFAHSNKSYNGRKLVLIAAAITCFYTLVSCLFAVLCLRSPMLVFIVHALYFF